MSLNIKIPSINVIGYPLEQKPLIIDKLNAIETNFGKIITTVADVTFVPREIIKSIIFIESGGKPDVESFICKKGKENSCPVGLMQISPETATNVPYKENKENRLTDPEKQLLYKWVGRERTDCILNMKYYNEKKACNNFTGVAFTKEELKKPTINILIGTMLFGMYIDLFSESSGKWRLDKAIIAYNKSVKTANKITGSIEDAITKLPKETSAYIKKFLGKGGVMDLLIA